MIRHDPQKWMAKVWAEVYGFFPLKGEGWASRKDNFYVGEFRAEHDRKTDSILEFVGILESGE